MARKYEEIMEYTEEWMKGLLELVVIIRVYLESVISIILNYRQNIIDESADDIIIEKLKFAKDCAPKLEEYEELVKRITEGIDEINGSRDLAKIDELIKTFCNICDSLRRTEHMFNQKEIKKIIDYLEERP